MQQQQWRLSGKKERAGQNGYETQAQFTLGVRAEKTLGQR
jgi:hypothetical protein